MLRKNLIKRNRMDMSDDKGSVEQDEISRNGEETVTDVDE